MALAIAEYPLVFNTTAQSFNIPGFDQVLRVGENRSGGMSIWVTQDTTKPTSRQTYQMAELGQPVPTLGTYIGSATIHPIVAGELETHQMFVWSS